jgi:hypothetical protein
MGPNRLLLLQKDNVYHATNEQADFVNLLLEP